MVGSGPDQAGPYQAEFPGSQRQEDFLNLERERDRERYREGSVHTTHTSKSHSQVGSHVSQKQNSNKTMQLEIDNLKKKLRCARRKRIPSSSDMSSNDEEDDKYRRRPIYYIRRSLHEAEIRYLSLEKVILAVVHATRKLPPLLPGANCCCLNSTPPRSFASKCTISLQEPSFWKVYVDGAANQRGSGVGLVLVFS